MVRAVIDVIFLPLNGSPCINRGILNHLFELTPDHSQKIICFRAIYWAPTSPSPNLKNESILFFDHGLGFDQQVVNNSAVDTGETIAAF